jgi:galactose oxidase
VFGGQSVPRVFLDVGAVLVPELWSPVFRNWTVLAPCKEARTYHSVAILLPSGHVFTGGGGLCNPIKNGRVSRAPPAPAQSVRAQQQHERRIDLDAPASRHLNYELFTPPYLLNPNGSLAERPVIVSSPPSAPHGAVIQVTVSQPVQSFALVRASATTHGSNNDQRRVVLSIVASVAAPNGTAVTYSLAIPASRGVVVPGQHMLFAMGLNGAPSVAKWLKCAFP